MIFLGVIEIQRDKVTKLHLESFCSSNLSNLTVKDKNLAGAVWHKMIIFSLLHYVKWSKEGENFNLAHAWMGHLSVKFLLFLEKIMFKSNLTKSNPSKT